MSADIHSIADARTGLSEIINRTAYRKERVVLTRRGKQVAAVVPIEDLELLEAIEDRLDLDTARKALNEAGKKGTMTWSSLKSELGL
ncbi:MAG: type II toxin-antitoxin system Phd/YefM family antitoxin [Gammaproteobacteria bacterium]|nr:type II toxin-antitoxin system Phd/YefM family antitoxin [Gammaproteobacteria bacterium]